MAIKEPIFAYDPADLLVFETVAKAEQYIEPADAFDSVYFDVEGQILNVSIEKDSREVEHTKILVSSSPAYDKNGLRKIIEDTLEYIGYSRNELKNKTYSELIQEIVKFKTE